MIRAVAVGGLLLTLALSSAEAAMACSCAPSNLKQGLADADGAVTARLLSVDLVGGDGPVSSADPADFVYRTGRVLKGSGLQRGRRLVVRSVRSDASCGLLHDVGGLTGLFLQREDGRWTSGLCSQTSRRQMLRAGRAGRAARMCG